jgi:hypothetical protein
LDVTDDPSSLNQAKRLFAGPDAPWRHLVEATELQTLQPFTFKSIAALIGQSKLNRHFEYPIRILRLVYETDYRDRKIHASGLLCLPLSHDEEPFPMMVLQNGMNFADSTAPSQFNFPDRFIGLEFLASVGYFVIVPDGIGFGASSDILFPMNNAAYAASATMDMMKAAEKYITTRELPYNDHIFMAGYSMGAYVTNASLRAIEARVYHAENDERIPFEESWNTFLAMLDAGSPSVEFEELVGINHFNAVFDFMDSVLPWFDTMLEQNDAYPSEKL